MSSTQIVFSLRNLDGGWWEVSLSNGTNETTLTASSIPSKSLPSLLKAVRALLQGAKAAQCSWEEAYGEYRWRFSSQDKQVLIHILRFDEMGVKKQTLFRMECDLLTFAKALLPQIGQFQYQDDDGPAVSDKKYQNFQKALITCEQAEEENFSEEAPEEQEPAKMRVPFKREKKR